MISNLRNKTVTEKKTTCIFRIMFLIFLGVWSLQSQTFDHQNPLDEKVCVLNKPVDFTGWQGDALNPKQLDAIRIGLFIPDDQNDSLVGSLHKAAQLAINEINSVGGIHGLPFKLIVCWANDPWGAGSKELIKLVYQDSVLAIIGSLDGNTTHIAEQIATKAWIPLLSPLSADPTLTYIRIPWMFRLPPDFQQQAEVLVKQGIQAMSIKKVGLITSIDHDGRIFAEEMLNQLQLANLDPLYHFQIPPNNFDPKIIAQRILAFGIDAIILQLQLSDVFDMLSQLKEDSVHTSVFLPWIPGLHNTLLTQYFDGDIYHIWPFAQSGTPAQVEFNHKYFKIYGISPSAGAAYTYDAVYLLFHALLRDAIAKIDGFQGVSGKISWDNGGGNQTVPLLRKLLFKTE
jgi:branched-chain amino acid transport system substrate-binding protein